MRGKGVSKQTGLMLPNADGGDDGLGDLMGVVGLMGIAACF